MSKGMDDQVLDPRLSANRLDGWLFLGVGDYFSWKRVWGKDYLRVRS